MFAQLRRTLIHAAVIVFFNCPTSNTWISDIMRTRNRIARAGDPTFSSSLSGRPALSRSRTQTKMKSAPSHGHVTRLSSKRRSRSTIADLGTEHDRNDTSEGEVSIDDETSQSEDLQDDNYGDELANEHDFTPRMRSTKRRQKSASHLSEAPAKRRQLFRGALKLSEESRKDIYLSPSSDGAVQKSPKRGPRSGLGKKKGKKMPIQTDKRRIVSDEKGDEEKNIVASVESPPWDSLPYLILSRIFTYASAPLDNIVSVRWLVAASQTCRAFAEPALRALYECPPLLTMNMAHTLVDQLETHTSTMFDYRQKVKSLKIDVGSLASRVYKGRHLDIARFVSCCPRLVDLDLYHYKDMPPYRQQTENLRWTYPRSLFEVLGAVPRHEEANPETSEAAPVMKLKSWRWNQRLMGKDMSLDSIKAFHLSPSFASLRHVSFVNYQRPSLDAKNIDEGDLMARDKQQAETFARSLDALPSLIHLTIESSTVVNEFLFPLLPKTLQSLELVNCWDVTALCFAEYLITHGQHLRHLTLHHNQSLSLAFLPVLGESCPELLTLRMNLTYYSHHAFYNDSNPMYDCLLSEEEVPSWPSTIELIELENLRKWEPNAAEMFFQSLVHSAPHISKLRVLTIKAMLDIPWRQRGEMRDRWQATLHQVFKRQFVDPVSSSSLQYNRKDKRATAGTSELPKPKTRKHWLATEPQRRSVRIAVNVSDQPSRHDSLSGRLRISQKSHGSYQEPDTDEDFDVSDDGDAKDSEAGDRVAEHPNGSTKNQGDFLSSASVSGPFLHGMCDVVDIRIDNQKPGEIQYRMVDFVDSDDSSSDDEWDGEGDGVEINDYAW